MKAFFGWLLCRIGLHKWTTTSPSYCKVQWLYCERPGCAAHRWRQVKERRSG